MTRIANLVHCRIPFIIGVSNTYIGLDTWAAFRYSDLKRYTGSWSYRCAGHVFIDLNNRDISEFRRLLTRRMIQLKQVTYDGAVFEHAALPFKHVKPKRKRAA